MATDYGFTPAIKARAIRLYQGGATLRQAAKRCSNNGSAPSHEAVRLWLLASGVALREPGPERREHERELVLALGRQGLLTADEIATAAEVSKASVYCWLSESGLRPGQSNRTRRAADLRSRIAELIASGRGAYEVADELGVTFGAVYYHLRLLGIRPLVDRRKVEHRRVA